MSVKRLHLILEEDDGSNWDYHVVGSIEQAIEDIDGGFGIINLKAPQAA